MIDKHTLNAISPSAAITKLLDGNQRFCDSKPLDRKLIDEVQKTTSSQYPYAIVLGCVDSRVPIELLFDQGVGDLFVTRVAGNFENDDIIASMEYACAVVGSKIIMVLGHEDCGAVKATCDKVELGHITALTERIKPAILATKIEGNISSKNKKCVDDVAKTNVALSIQRIRAKSKILRNLESEGSIKIVGAFYSVSTGMVSLLD